MTYAIHTGTSEKRAERVIRCFDLSFYGWFLTSIEIQHSVYFIYIYSVCFDEFKVEAQLIYWHQ